MSCSLVTAEPVGESVGELIMVEIRAWAVDETGICRACRGIKRGYRVARRGKTACLPVRRVPHSAKEVCYVWIGRCAAQAMS